MSKLNFKRLSRGVKLLTDHIHAQLQSALTLVTSTKVPQENLEQNAGVSRLSFSWPVAQGIVVGTPDNYLSAAFNLLPPQEEFRNDGILNPDDPTLILDTLSFSFDVRDEAARLQSSAVGFPATSTEGALDFTDVDKLSFKISIFEKIPNGFSGATSATNFDKTVFSIDYPNTLYSGKYNRNNPVVLEDIGVMMNPYRTYLLVVDCSSYLSSSNFQVNSVMVSMTFNSTLRLRDSGSTNVQNIPQSTELAGGEQYGGSYVSAETITTPAAGAVIKAETTGSDTGVQGSFEKIDAAVRHGLSGGYTTKGRRFGYESLLNDAAYQVIAVPMWGNGWLVKPGQVWNQYLPYMGVTPYSDTVVDRRIIPIHYPMVIHHVTCFLNYQECSPPTTGTFSYQVGVGIGCGLRSDSHSYRQVAFKKIDSATVPFDNYTASPTAVGTVSGYGKIYDIPLVGTGGLGLSLTTGKPFYVGQTNSTEELRSPAAEAVGGAAVSQPSIDGKEQWIEVRMSLGDSAGIENMPASQGLVGYGGHWVYIIGKRHAC